MQKLEKTREVANKLDAYIRFRAEQEGVGYDLSPEFFEIALRKGCVNFFGVEIENYNLVSDEQQPALFRKWNRKH